MFKFLLFLLLIGLFGFLILGVLLGRVIRFFGPADKTRSNQQRKNSKSQYSNTENTPQKKFSKNEGEYTSYEEVRDDE